MNYEKLPDVLWIPLHAPVSEKESAMSPEKEKMVKFESSESRIDEVLPEEEIKSIEIEEQESKIQAAVNLLDIVKAVNQEIQNKKFDEEEAKKIDRIEGTIKRVEGSIKRVEGSIKRVEGSIKRVEQSIKRVEETIGKDHSDLELGSIDETSIVSKAEPSIQDEEEIELEIIPKAEKTKRKRKLDKKIPSSKIGPLVQKYERTIEKYERKVETFDKTSPKDKYSNPIPGPSHIRSPEESFESVATRRKNRKKIERPEEENPEENDSNASDDEERFCVVS